MNSVRESIPVETILRAYMDEADEKDVEVHEVEEKIPIVEEVEPEPEPEPEPVAASVPVSVPVPVKEAFQPVVDQSQSQSRLSFSNIDKAIDITGIESAIEAPKTIERLEQLAANKPSSREDDDEDEDDERLKIGDNISLDISDINDLSRPLNLLPPPVLDDIVILS